jgi:hypothetical protein
MQVAIKLIVPDIVIYMNVPQLLEGRVPQSGPDGHSSQQKPSDPARCNELVQPLEEVFLPDVP